MSKGGINWQITVIFCICILVVINIFVIVKLILVLGELKENYPSRIPLPCGAIPIRFVIGEPKCVDKLLGSINVTNDYVIPSEAFHSLSNGTLRL